MPTLKFHYAVAAKLTKGLDADICTKKSNCSKQTLFYRASPVLVPSHKAGQEESALCYILSICQTATEINKDATFHSCNS